MILPMYHRGKITYRPCLLIKAVMLFFCTECSETQVAASSLTLTDQRKLSVLFLMAQSLMTTSSNA